MYQNNYDHIFTNPMLVSLIVFLVLWELLWKAKGLWRSARNGDKLWFIVMLVVNMAGILPILYLFVFSKPKSKKKKK